jgi:hypothetical protein
MDATRCVATLLATMVSVHASASPLFEADRGGQRSVCGFVLDRLEKYASLFVNADVPVGTGGATAIVGDWKWETGWTYSTSGGEVAATFARYDLDNDGLDEIVFYRSGMLRSQSNTGLVVYKSGSRDPIDTSIVNMDELEQVPGIFSGTSSFPYRSYGLQNLSIAPLSLNGTNYVVIMDGLFGHKHHPDRRLAVAQYTGVPINKSKEDATAKLEIICSFKPRDR